MPVRRCVSPLLPVRCRRGPGGRAPGAHPRGQRRSRSVGTSARRSGTAAAAPRPLFRGCRPRSAMRPTRSCAQSARSSAAVCQRMPFEFIMVLSSGVKRASRRDSPRSATEPAFGLGRQLATVAHATDRAEVGRVVGSTFPQWNVVVNLAGDAGALLGAALVALAQAARRGQDGFPQPLPLPAACAGVLVRGEGCCLALNDGEPPATPV